MQITSITSVACHIFWISKFDVVTDFFKKLSQTLIIHEQLLVKVLSCMGENRTNVQTGPLKTFKLATTHELNKTVCLN